MGTGSIWQAHQGSSRGENRIVQNTVEAEPPSQGILKRYGVLHPYPLHSLWRSSPGQIRNLPVDATAS